MYDDDLEGDLCQCINCRLARMEKKLAMMQDTMATLMGDSPADVKQKLNV